MCCASRVLQAEGARTCAVRTQPGASSSTLEVAGLDRCVWSIQEEGHLEHHAVTGIEPQP